MSKLMGKKIIWDFPRPDLGPLPNSKMSKHVFKHIFMPILMSFYGGQLKQQICYSLTLIISFMVFNLFKMGVQF